MGVETNNSTGGLNLRKVESRNLTGNIAFNPHNTFLTIRKPYTIALKFLWK